MERSGAIFVGGLRTASRNRKVAAELIARTPASLRPEIIEISQLRHNQDFDDTGNPSADWVASNAK